MRLILRSPCVLYIYFVILFFPLLSNDHHIANSLTYIWLWRWCESECCFFLIHRIEHSKFFRICVRMLLQCVDASQLHIRIDKNWKQSKMTKRNKYALKTTTTKFPSAPWDKRCITNSSPPLSPLRTQSPLNANVVDVNNFYKIWIEKQSTQNNRMQWKKKSTNYTAAVRHLRCYEDCLGASQSFYCKLAVRLRSKVSISIKWWLIPPFESISPLFSAI